ncbi:MAG: ATP-binding protein [Geminicoccaceae bacterium]
MAERLRGIEVQLDAIEEFSAHQLHRPDDQTALRPELDRLQAGIRSDIQALQGAVRDSLTASKEREALVSSLSRDHIDFLDIIDPVIAASRSDMIASTRRSVADGTARISSLIDDSFEALRGVLELQANINLLIAMSHQVAATNDVSLVYDRRSAAVAPIAAIKNAFSQIPETDAAQRLRDLAQEIIGRAIGADNIFALRKGILGDEAAAGPLRDRLAREVSVLDQAQASFLTLAAEVIESVDGGILEAATGASREGQHIITETQSGIGRFETVLLLQSDTNQLFSVLSEAAATNRVEEIQALERRYDVLNRNIERHLAAWPADSEVRASVDRLLAYGRDDRSILAIRLRELAARQEAAALLHETQRLTSQLSESTHGLVEDAEASAHNASTEALGSLAQGMLAFVSIAAFSLVVAVLIAWRYAFRRIVRRLIDLSTTMLTLAEGNLETEMPSTRGNDEITDMSKALLIFRDDAVRRREAERAVRENEQRMRRILASSPIGVAIASDEDARVRYGNERMAQQFGMAETELVGRHASEFYVDARDRNTLLELYEREGFVRDAEVRAKRADGTGFWSLFSLFPIQYKGTDARLLWAYDITSRKKTEQDLRVAKEQAETALAELKAAEERLVHTEKMASLGQLTAGIAHEIKNPLNFVNNFSKLSIEIIEELRQQLDTLEPGNGATVREDIEDNFEDLALYLNKVGEHGQRADNIVRGMLAHSRESTGSAEQIDVNGLLDEFANLAYHGMRAQDSAFNITIERDFDATIGTVEVVPQDLGRVFLNIISNALQATFERAKRQGEEYRPTLWLTTRRQAGEVEIRIRDNGPGMPRDVLDKIFQPFFTTKPVGEGTGLGLSISYDIVVEQHHGRLHADSIEGEGAEFVIGLRGGGAPLPAKST